MNANGFEVDLSKGRHHPNSAAAFESLNVPEAQMEVLRLLQGARGGLTGKEVARATNKELHAVSGRLSELKQQGLAVEGIERRDRCGVVHITDKGREALVALNQRRLF